MRLQIVHQLRGKLERDGFPRLQMFLLVAITGVAGFIASYALLRAGLSAMWVRYLVAFFLAYLVFLLLLWLWLRTRAHDYTDFPDITGGFPSPNQNSELNAGFVGKGGDFGGGGASSSFGGPIENVPLVSDAGGPVGEVLGVAAEAEEFAIPLAVIVLVGALLLSSLFVVYSAPVLFAELLVDGALAASLYRRLRGLEKRHWLETAVRCTFWPFLLTALFVAAAGWAMAHYVPGAHSIGDALFHSK